MNCPECNARPNQPHEAACRRYNALLADLGTATDREVSLRHGVGESTVRKLRREAGILPFQPRRAPMKNKRPTGPGRWASADWRLDNTALGAAMNVSRDAARKARRKWGVPPERVKPAAVEAPARVPTTAERLAGADLTRPIRDLMREYSVTKYAVEQARKTRGVDLRANPRSRVLVDIPVERLGKVSDHELAAEYGLTATAVAQRRKKYGVSAFKPVNAAGGFQRRTAGTRPVVALGAQAPLGGRKAKPIAPVLTLKQQLAEEEPEPTGKLRPEMVLPSSVDTSGMSTRERAIVRAVRAGKPWGWIEATYGATREEVLELGVGA